MYIRQISRKNKDGSRVRYLQLAHKVRDPDSGTPRDQVLYHFGREDQLDKEQLKRLVLSFSRFLRPADRAQIHARLELGADLLVQRSRAYGGSFLLDALWQRLGLDQTLRALLKQRSYQADVERLLFALVLNRALAPRSKRALERWVGSHVLIDGLETVAVHTLYRAMDFLLKHEQEIQKKVFFATADLLNLEVDLLFFDTTSSYFEVDEPDEEGEGLRRRGHSKDHRPDLPQVVIGLAVTKEGIPVRSWVLPGNTQDVTTVEQIQQDLAGWRLGRCIWVMDRGMTSAKNKIILQRAGGHYILGEKMRDEQPDHQAALSHRGRYRPVRDNLKVKEVVLGQGAKPRRYVVVLNPQQARRDKVRREEWLQRLEQELAALGDLKGKGHNKAVCALISHRRMGRYLRQLKSGALRVNRAKVRAEERLDGKYLLSSSDPSLSAEEIALGYKQLMEVERAFRSLKQTLELRPMYHHKDERIRTHVTLCWLSLLLVRIIERETGQTWERIREEFERLVVVDLRSKDGTAQLTSELTSEQRQVLKEMKIKPPKRVRSAHLSPSRV